MKIAAKQKIERHEVILQSAEQIIRESGVDTLSMRNLAKHAGVAEVTPYNLFGNKQGILVALAKPHFAHLAVKLPSENHKAPELVGQSDLWEIKQISDLYQLIDSILLPLAKDADYLRAVLRAIRFSGEDLIKVETEQVLIKLVCAALTQLVEHKQLVKDTPVRLVASQAVLAIYGAYIRWQDGFLPTELFLSSVRHSFDLLLLSFAKTDTRDYLISHLTQLNKA